MKTKMRELVWINQCIVARTSYSKISDRKKVWRYRDQIVIIKAIKTSKLASIYLSIYLSMSAYIYLLLYTSMWLQEKYDWREDLVYFVYWINRINKWMKYLASWWWVVYLVTSGCFDLVGRCCRMTPLGQPAIQLACNLCLAYLYVPNFKHRLQKILLVEKIWSVEK